jgi:hypothetical protein
VFNRFCLIAIVLLIAVVYASAWWNSNWDYRKNVTINNSGGPLTDFQVKLEVDYNDHMNPDYSDLRFLLPDDQTKLDYWIESSDGTNGAVVWVKIPQIPSGNSNIRMYYGNPIAPKRSNIKTTFVFGDDFAVPSWSESNWTVIRGDWSFHSGYCEGENVGSPADGYMLAPDSGLSNYVVEGRVLHPGSLGNCVSILGRGSANPPNQYYEVEVDQNNMQVYRFDGPGDYTSLGGDWSGAPPQPGTWYTLSLTFYSSTITGECGNNGATVTATDSNYTSGLTGVMVFNQTGKFDDFRVRKYSANMPTGSFGSEEEGPANVESKSFGEIKAIYR